MSLWPPATATPTGRMLDALCELLECCAFSHRRPPFGIASIVVDGDAVPIVESRRGHTVRHAAAFPQGAAGGAPAARADRRSHVRAFRDAAARHRAHDARRPRRVHHRLAQPARYPLTAGRFGFDEYVAHVIDFIHQIGPDAHVLAICQPTVAALAAVALMAAGGDPAQPASLTLMAADRLPRESDEGQRARDEPADRMVRAQPDQRRAGRLRRRAAPCIRASCRWARSCR